MFTSAEAKKVEMPSAPREEQGIGNWFKKKYHAARDWFEEKIASNAYRLKSAAEP